MADCGVPIVGDGVVTGRFNNTNFKTMVTFHCEHGDVSLLAVCGINGMWLPNPFSFKCVNGTLGNYITTAGLQIF